MRIDVIRRSVSTESFFSIGQNATDQQSQESETQEEIPAIRNEAQENIVEPSTSTDNAGPASEAPTQTLTGPTNESKRCY